MEFEKRRKPARTRVRARVGRVIPSDILDKTWRILNDCDEIRLDVFTILWDVRYDELFDPTELNFDNGLCGFLEQTNMVELRYVSDIEIYARLRDELRSSQEVCLSNNSHINQDEATKQSSFKVRTIDPDNPLFDPENTFLWTEWLQPFLLKDNFARLTITKTPLEQRYRLNRQGVQRQIDIIRAIFANTEGGIPLNELNKNYLISLRVLNHVDMNCLVCEFNELFFIEEPREYGQDKIVYYGVEKTLPDSVLAGSWYKRPELTERVDRIVAFSLITGIYQATLLLVKRAGKYGLKLAAWHSSMIQNFPNIKRYIEERPIEGDAIRLFCKWASRELIIVKPGPESKNDLRVLLPTKSLDFELILFGVQKRLKIRRQEMRAERLRNITSYGTKKSRESSVETLDTGYNSKESTDSRSGKSTLDIT